MVKIKKNVCDYCGTCVGVCPENCIDLAQAQLKIIAASCTECKNCVIICPLEALEMS